MQYCIMTSTGFQMSGPDAALYNTVEEAMKHAGPGDQILPVVESDNVVQFVGKDDRDR